MHRICIVTDSTAQFPNPTYLGHELVQVAPIHISIGHQTLTDRKDPKDYKHLVNQPDGQTPCVMIPDVESLGKLFLRLGSRYQNILVILHSSQLSPLVENARVAAEAVKNPDAIHIIDSQTIGAGLGLLVQTAAHICLHHHDPATISQMVRGTVPHIYTALFLPNLKALARSGYLDPDQAVVGEMLGFFPFYLLEPGRMVSIQKARTMRQLVDMTTEFVTEFDGLRHVALFQGYPPYEPEMRSLHERITKAFPNTPITEHYLSLSQVAMLGPRAIGAVVMQEPERS